jgi:K+-transporting ATPase c subunit
MSTLHDQSRGDLSIVALAKLEALRGFTSACHVRQSLLRGEPGVNVLKLNFALDKLQGK